MTISGLLNGELAKTEAETAVVSGRDGLLVIKTDMRLQEVFIDGKTVSDGNSVAQVEVEVESERDRIIRERFQSALTNAEGGQTGTGGHAKVVKSPMPGLVKAINVAVGDHVKRSTTVIILEAMKMENSIAAGADGIIKKLSVTIGNSIEKGAAICEIEGQ
ncbi:MAG: hypothetical protein JSS75_05290 [Bacteroidetes bacterium]|nr:hypothetical protein [Bacteroidota bacterium]